MVTLSSKAVTVVDVETEVVVLVVVVLVEVLVILAKISPINGNLMYPVLTGTQSDPPTNLKFAAHLQTPAFPPSLIRHMCAQPKLLQGEYFAG